MVNSPEMRAKISVGLQGKKCGLGNKSRKGQKRSSEEIQKQLATRRARYPNGFHHSDETKHQIAFGHIGIQTCLGKKNALGYRHTPEMKAYLSKINKGHVVSPETKGKISVGNMGKACSKEVRKRIRDTHLANRDRLVMNGRKAWEDPEKVAVMMANMLKARQKKPNRLEERFQIFLDKHFPNAWRYVGDGGLIISGKCPDFVNVNGRKQIIEIFGDYWHQGEDEQGRIKIFENYGFDTLVLWESEINLMTEEEMVKCIEQFAVKTQPMLVSM